MLIDLLLIPKHKMFREKIVKSAPISEKLERLLCKNKKYKDIDFL